MWNYSHNKHGKIKNAHTILVAKPAGKNLLGRSRQRQKILKWILMKYTVLYIYGIDQWWAL
jgi:hypothetical protein